MRVTSPGDSYVPLRGEHASTNFSLPAQGIGLPGSDNMLFVAKMRGLRYIVCCRVGNISD